MMEPETIMSIAPLIELIDKRTRVMPLTVAVYHRMIRQGMIPEGEPYELLNGYIVEKDRSKRGEDPMTISEEHAWVVKKLAELDPELRKLGCHMQTQQPITLPPYDEPEPDGAIVRGIPDDYRRHHPAAADVLCVIEVSDSSLHRDRVIKKRIYAGGGIPHYFIINLQDREIEVFADPQAPAGRYATTDKLTTRQKLSLPTARTKPLVIPVKRLLS
jgi:Uma2 family endonuclease